MMKMKLTSLFASVALAMVGCAAPAPQTAPQTKSMTEVHIKLTDFKIELDKSIIPAGPVKFLIDNTGAITHELVLELSDVVDVPFEVNGKVSEAEAIAPSKSKSFEWTLDKPGNYRLACHINENDVDHFKLGMTTEITVTAP
jgi:uncharacterized cupredoxin-like copper-binding protein